jgi:hypothetical protein
MLSRLNSTPLKIGSVCDHQICVLIVYKTLLFTLHEERKIVQNSLTNFGL